MLRKLWALMPWRYLSLSTAKFRNNFASTTAWLLLDDPKWSVITPGLVKPQEPNAFTWRSIYFNHHCSRTMMGIGELTPLPKLLSVVMPTDSRLVRCAACRATKVIHR